jgi:haloalkane dehalogenase
MNQATSQSTSQMSAHDAAELFRQPPARFIDVGEGEVAYRKVGSGPDVLFVHGWPVSGATFRTLLPFLVPHVTCHIIDFPGAGSSKFTDNTSISLQQHITTLQRVMNALDFDSVSVVGHDSGGLIARYALADDKRVRSFALLDTEQSHGLSLKFKSFIASRHLPGLTGSFAFLFGNKRLRKNRLLLGDTFVDSSLIDGEFLVADSSERSHDSSVKPTEFDEFFLQPIHKQRDRTKAAVRLLKTFDTSLVDGLEALHRRITVPVHLVWGAEDKFFPLAWAKEMVGTFPNARLTVIDNAGLFSHEERPKEVASALLSSL